MEDADRYIATLNELGLGITEARVYVTLAKAEILSAKEIAELSGVARPEVYQALYQLEKAGLAKILVGESMHFEAVPIDECFSTLLLDRVKKTAELKEKALKLTRDFKRCLPEREVHEQTQFVLISKKAAIFTKAQKMTENAQECICFLGLTKRVLAWLSLYSPSVEEALARKVNCRMIIPKPKNVLWKPLKRLLKHPNFELRLVPEQPETAYGIYDRKEILMTTSASDTATPAAVLWSNNKSILNLCREHFDCLWVKSEKASLNKQ